MKIRRKQNNCLNCGASLDGVYNYCPICGQENNNNNVSFGTLIHDFFSNYFAFDSRFAKSIGPFLFKPGFLTNRYIEGKRMSYAHPLRLYLIISLFYFFVGSLVVKDMLRDTDEAIAEFESENNPLAFLPKDQRDKLSESISAKSMDEVLEEMERSNNPDLEDFAEAVRRHTTLEEREEIGQILSQDFMDSLNIDLLTPVIDSARTETPESPTADPTPGNGLKQIDLTKEGDSRKTQITIDTTSNILLFQRIEDIYDMSKEDRFSEDRIIDSLATGPISKTSRYITKQGIRIMRAEKEQVGAYIVKNLPIMMLILIPIFALLLKLLYVKRKFLYIHHMIHGFHLHSFSYLFYGITLILLSFVIENEGWSSFIGTTVFILVTTYAYVSFLRVYKQGWFKTLVKFNLAGILYFTVIMFFVFLEMLISLLLY